MVALRCCVLPEGTALKPMGRHARLRLFLVACTRLRIPATPSDAYCSPVVVLELFGIVWLFSASMFHALGVCLVACVCIGLLLLIIALYIMLGESLLG